MQPVDAGSRQGTRPDAPRSARQVARCWWAVLVLALLAGLSMLAFPLAPVVQHTATYQWRSADGPVALPLNPYRPERLTLSLDCAAIGADAGPVLTTVRAVDPDLRSGRLDVAVRGGELVLTSRGTEVRAGAYPCGRVVVSMDTAGTRVSRDGVVLVDRPGDLRPAIDGFSGPGDWPPDVVDDPISQGEPGSFTRTPAPVAPGIEAEVVADTQWDSSPTALKIALGVVAGVFLLAALVFAVLADRRPRQPSAPPRRTRGGFWKRHWDDLVLVPVFAFGVIAGGATDDDGFIAQILRTRTMSGYLGNYVRWNNAPEAPFGWFYELLSRWGAVSWEPVWLRLLPLLVAILGWVVVRHGLLPRLVSRPGIWVRLTLLSGFAGFWLVFCNALRPELWFAVGSGIVVWCVLVALHRRWVWPLLIGALVAGLTVGVGPTGLLALAPFVVAVRPLWRWLRHDRLRLAAVSVAWLACLGAVVPIMFADQSLTSVLSSNSARATYGPVFPVWMDPIRYWRLYQSYAARQWTVYLAAVALVLLGWRLWRVRRGAVGMLSGVNRRVAWLVVGTALGLVVAMALSPTKLPHHFGSLLLLGPLAMAACVRLVERDRGRGFAAVLLGGSVAMFGISLHGNNTWWKLSTLGLLADKNPLRVGPVPVWPFVVLAGVLLGVCIWRGLPGWLRAGRLRAGWRAGRAAGAYTLGVVVLVGSQYANFAQAAILRGPDRYTMASAALSAMAGEPCKLARSLAYEPDPSAGVLRTSGAMPFDGTDAGLPVWTANPAAPDRLETGWYDWSDSVHGGGRWPLVIAASGLDAGHRVRVEFNDGSSKQLSATRKTLGTSALSDIRVEPGNRVSSFRLVAESDGAPMPDPKTGQVEPFVVSAPRVPVTRPLLELVQEKKVAIAWNLAFFGPCFDTPRESRGRVEIADYLLSDSRQPGNISYNSRSGGPFAGVLGLTVPSRVPVYALDDYSESDMSALDLVRLDPMYGTDAGAPMLGDRVRNGWDPVPTVP
ncbi:arabinosyltransferase domain-containing protein [Enemella evansiae]|uniref:arabinosyltransferase domain-containing protein n=1 Tax=Enemella evansiae TaxID=2016499 RepID=UPI000B95EB07|nr:arabinosyltransferase domain-containing protein [Enemella evansiae]